MKDFFNSKTIRIIGSIVIIIGILFLLMNASYFYKQVKFLFRKPVAVQYRNSSNGVSVERGNANQLNIPSLGITAPIVEAGVSDGRDKSIEKDYQEALKTGVVHYPGTADIGKFGNAYLFGHSSDFIFKGGNYKTVFALLPKIEKGAEIIATDKNGQIFHYEVVDSRAIQKDDFTVLGQRDNKEKLLTLQTSYPIGTALKRWIVLARLKE